MCEHCKKVKKDDGKLHVQSNTDGFKCKDCGVDTAKLNEYYMVREQLWKTVGVGEGMLCIGCLEKRLGRTLENFDFTDAPVNNSLFFEQSERLANRLSINREQNTLWK